MMEMNPNLIDEASNSSSSDELLSDASSEDGGGIVPMQITDKYEQSKQTPAKENKKKVTSPTSSSARKTARQSPPQQSTTSSSTKSSGKRKAEESVPVEEAQTQKRRRKPTAVKKKRDDRTDAKRIEPLPMNPDGTLKLPVTIGKGTNEVTIHRIGEIVWDREAYHTNRYIFPVGFMSKKQYLSAVDVTRRTTYTSEILDGGDTPIFQITAEDQPGRKFVASSSSGVWKKILDEINVQGVPSKTHASGPEMLGLSHLGITKYIQELPGAEKCTKYVMQRWIDDNDDHHNQYSSPSLQQHPQLQSPTSQQLLQQPPSSASSTTSSSSTFSHMQQQHSLSSSPSNYRHPHHPHHHHHHQQQQQMSHNVKTEPLMDEIEDNREIDDDVDDIDDDAFNKDFKSTNGYH